MKGLEIAEIRKSELERTHRIDSEFFNKKYNILGRFNEKNSQSIIDLIHLSDGNHLAISDNYVENGVPYYRGQDTKDFFVENSTPKYLPENIYNQPYMKRSHLKKGDILLSIVGTIGNLSLVYSDQKATCSAKLAILRPKESIAELLAIFLKTKYGQLQIERLTRGAVQQGLIMEDIDQIRIPLFSKKYSNLISKLVLQAFKLSEESKDAYKNAENYLLKKLGITFDYYDDLSSSSISEKSYKESFEVTGRLDAEYYQPKYSDLMKKITSVPYKKLQNLVDIFKSIEPGSDEYQNEGIPFIRVANLTPFEITEASIFLSKEKYGNLKLFPKEDTILFSKDGSVGIAYQVFKDAQFITSSAILHLNIKESLKNSILLLPEYLTLILNSKIVQTQAERDAGGSIIQHWRISQIENVVVPILEINDQVIIKSLVEESFELKEKANHILEIVKLATELVIEDSEEVAFEYINNQLSNTNFHFISR